MGLKYKRIPFNRRRRTDADVEKADSAIELIVIAVVER
jgi:hypothetical protein